MAAGCWTHARRPFAQIVKSMGEEKAVGTVAYEALVQIQNIYHTDKPLLKLPNSKRKEKRKALVKPLVDHFFKWCKESQSRIPSSSETAIPKHMDDTSMEFLDDLLPWSDNLPDICRKKIIKINIRRRVKSAALIISMHGWFTVYHYNI